MKNLSSFLMLAVTLGGLLLSSQSVTAQGTAFTYQGQLANNGLPANGSYDFIFALYNNSSTNTGQQVGGALTNLAVSVTGGLFTVALDFGPVFTGNATWLAIGVETNGGGGFTALNPLQAITPAPYAIYAPSAGSVAATNLVGAVSVGQLPASVITNGASGVNLAGTFTGDGSGLVNISPTATNYIFAYRSAGSVVVADSAAFGFPITGTANGIISTGNGSSFTIPATGTYLITFMIMVQGNNVLSGGANPSATVVQIMRNGNGIAGATFQFNTPAGATTTPFTGQAIVALTAGNAITLGNLSSAGSAAPNINYGTYVGAPAVAASFSIIQIK